MHLAIHKSWFLRFIVFIIIIKGWVVIASFLGLPIFLISSFVLLYLSRYRFTLRKLSVFFLSIFLILPLIIDLRSGQFSISHFAEILLGLFIFNIGILIKKDDKIGRLLDLSIFVTSVLAIFSVFKPDSFAGYASLSDSLYFYNFRAFGLYLQPNSLAMAINFILIPWHRYSNRNFVILSTALIAVIAAASRIGIVFGALHLLYGLFYKSSSRKHTATHVRNVFVKLILITMVGAVVISVMELDMFAEIVRRLTFFSDLDIQSDGSFNDRLSYQRQYLKYLYDQPFFGYGFLGSASLIELGFIHDVAHSLHYDTVLAGGLVTYLFLLFFLITHLVDFKSYHMRWWWLMFLVYSFFSTTLITERIVLLTLGLLFDED